jgi:hypothetical protein
MDRAYWSKAGIALTGETTRNATGDKNPARRVITVSGKEGK